MIANYTFFACGSMGNEFMALVFAVLALWIVSGVLFLANLCLLFALRDGPLLRNASGLLLYVAAGLVAYSYLNSGSGSNVELVLLFLTCGLPVIVIGHFICLFRQVRRERRALRSEPQPS